MNPEKHVVNLELSQKLKAVGFPQDETLFVWVKEKNTEQWSVHYREDAIIFLSEYNWCAAPIATEIELLTLIKIKEKRFSDETERYTLTITPEAGDSFVSYEDSKKSVLRTIADTEANAKSKMWLTHPETRKI